MTWRAGEGLREARRGTGMATESYTRWRSGASDDDDEDEGVDKSAGAGRGAVTIITKPQLLRRGRLTLPAQTRVATVMVS